MTRKALDDDDPFFQALVEAMTRPLPQVGDRVRVDGRRGTLVDIRTPYTCSCCYVVEYEDGELVDHWYGDFWLQSADGTVAARENPVIEVGW